MSLLSLSISILWVVLGIIVLCAIVWVALWALKQFLPFPPVVEQLVWACVVILVLIGVLSAIAGVGPLGHGFRFSTTGLTDLAWTSPYLPALRS